jgi:NADPH:quinone reductase-like Zn-dependent oxidoreductase
MRVVVGERVGGPEVLGVAERAAPRPGPGEIVVDVAAAGVNFMDIYGELDVRISRTYPLAEAAQAQEDLAARRTTGKLLLLPSQ